MNSNKESLQMKIPQKNTNNVMSIKSNTTFLSELNNN